MDTFIGQLPGYFRSMSDALEEVYRELNLPLLSGGSGKGWSMWSTLQRCPRAYYYRYEEDHENNDRVEEAKSNLGVGSLVHALLAVHYLFMLRGEAPPIDHFIETLLTKDVSPETVYEAKRLFEPYVFRYEQDYLIPLAIEFTAKDKRSGNTCRYDLIARVDDPPLGMFPGVYIVEHKTARSIHTWEAQEGWYLDGEILGEIGLWKKGGMDKKFGDLRGVIVNLIAKTQTPDFDRKIVPADETAAKYHLKILGGMKTHKDNMRRARWPRFLQGCITRYGRCDYWSRCQVEVSE